MKSFQDFTDHIIPRIEPLSKGDAVVLDAERHVRPLAFIVIAERSEESRLLASPYQGEADARPRASGEGQNSKSRSESKYLSNVLLCSPPENLRVDEGATPRDASVKNHVKSDRY